MNMAGYDLLISPALVDNVLRMFMPDENITKLNYTNEWIKCHINYILSWKFSSSQLTQFSGLTEFMCGICLFLLPAVQSTASIKYHQTEKRRRRNIETQYLQIITWACACLTKSGGKYTKWIIWKPGLHFLYFAMRSGSTSLNRLRFDSCPVFYFHFRQFMQSNNATRHPANQAPFWCTRCWSQYQWIFRPLATLRHR